MIGLAAREDKKILVSQNALHQVLDALNGPAYMIRELQITKGLPGGWGTNPIEKLQQDLLEAKTA